MRKVTFRVTDRYDGGWSDGSYDPAERYYAADVLVDGVPTGRELIRVGCDNCEIRDAATGDNAEYLGTDDLRSAQAEVRRMFAK